MPHIPMVEICILFAYTRPIPEGCPIGMSHPSSPNISHPTFVHGPRCPLKQEQSLQPSSAGTEDPCLYSIPSIKQLFLPPPPSGLAKAKLRKKYVYQGPFINYLHLHCKPISCNEKKISLCSHSHRGNHVIIAGILFSLQGFLCLFFI